MSTDSAAEMPTGPGSPAEKAIRHGRMLQSPFTFYRDAAAVMAADLTCTPATGIRVQACGDCHLLNFGGFAVPERNILFDINHFDETLPGHPDDVGRRRAAVPEAPVLTMPVQRALEGRP
jgi:uncharacterized protein (DUF2252 family)